MSTLAKVATRALLVIVILGLSAWAALALHLGPPQSTFWAAAMAAVGLLAAISAVLRIAHRLSHSEIRMSVGSGDRILMRLQDPKETPGPCLRRYRTVKRFPATEGPRSPAWLHRTVEPQVQWEQKRCGNDATRPFGG